MKKTSLLWILLAFVLSFSMSSCSTRDESDDNETYHTRNYIITNASTWYANRVKKADGTWSDHPFSAGLQFNIEFTDRKTNGDARKFNSWEFFGQTDVEKGYADSYTGDYLVEGKVINATVDGQPYMRFVVTQMSDQKLGGTVTFYKQNLTLEVVMSPYDNYFN